MSTGSPKDMYENFHSSAICNSSELETTHTKKMTIFLKLYQGWIFKGSTVIALTWKRSELLHRVSLQFSENDQKCESPALMNSHTTSEVVLPEVSDQDLIQTISPATDVQEIEWLMLNHPMGTQSTKSRLWRASSIRIWFLHQPDCKLRRQRGDTFLLIH